jgi:GNAT superfamily N-acetyltransferase
MKLDAPADDEWPLIYDSWARSFKKSPWAGCITNDLYDQVSRRTMQEIISRGAKVTVACVDLPDGGRRVLGYSVSEPRQHVLHWLFVKRDYRGMGVGKALLEDVTLSAPQGDCLWTYTFRTKASVSFLGPRFWWDPTHARVPAKG